MQLKETYSKDVSIIGLIGLKASFSLSPLIMNTAFQVFKMPYVYKIYNFKDINACTKLLRDKKFKGFNVTFPYKVSIINYLDKLDETALRAGAVNVVVRENDFLIGYNTDGLGYLRALLEDIPNIKLVNQKVVLLGSGGAACAIALALAENGVKQLVIASRNLKTANNLVKNLKNYTFAKAVDLSLCKDEVLTSTLVINATPVGIFSDAMPLPCEFLTKGQIVSDIIYMPLLTKFLKCAFKKGAIIQNGLNMLLHQAALSFELWFKDKKFPLKIVKEVLFTKLKEHYCKAQERM